MKKEGKGTLFISIAFFVITVCVFGPLDLYVSNRADLWFGFTDALIVVGLMSGVAIVVLGGIGLLLRGKLRALYAALLFIGTLCMYIQGNYANISYGVLDGRTIVWDDYMIYAIIDTVVWIAVIIGLLLLRNRKPALFQGMVKMVSLFIVAVQMLTLCVLFISGDVLNEEDGNQLTTDHITEVGKNDNIVIFVLDTFEDSLMDDLMATDGEYYQNLFADFTRFTDCAAGGATTAAAMPIIINGEYYTEGLSYGEYINNTFNADGFYSALKARGYNVGLYTEAAFARPSMNGYVDNYNVGQGKVSSYAGLTEKYSEFTLFKYMPHVLKQYFWLYTGEFSQYQSGESYTIDDAEYYNIIKDGLQVVGNNSFRLYHLSGAHYPYTLNDHAEPETETTREQQAKGTLYIVEEYIKQMKACGVYDDALIVIMADHGNSEHYSSSILFVKDRGAKGEYTENDAPVSHLDLHATLFSYLGIENGNTFFDISEEEQRDRLFYLRLSEGGNFYMQEYVIPDKVSIVGCGTETGRKLGPKKEKSLITLGARMGLEADGQALSYIVSGMDIWPLDSVETQGTEAVFSFPLEGIQNKALNISIEIARLYRYDLEQSVQVYANGELCHEEPITDAQTIRFTVAPELLKEEHLEIKLVLATKWCSLYISGVTIDYATDADMESNSI